MAIDVLSEEIIGRWSETPGVRIVSISGFKQDVPVDPDKNAAGIAAMTLLKHLGEESRGLDLKIHKHIRSSNGLGSSASGATAAVVLVNELLKTPLEKRDLIPFAMEGETVANGVNHGCNVVPALLGGLMLIRDIETYDYHRVFTPPGLYVAVLLPDLVISKKTAAPGLKSDVSLDDMVHQSSNLGALIIGMQQGDLGLISRSMQDHVIEIQLKHLIPHFDEVKNVALQSGALGCGISGTGPAVFALCQEKLQASLVANAMQKVYETNKLAARSFVCGINHEGTVVK